MLISNALQNGEAEANLQRCSKSFRSLRQWQPHEAQSFKVWRLLQNDNSHKPTCVLFDMVISWIDLT